MSSQIQSVTDGEHPGPVTWHDIARIASIPATSRSNWATQMAEHTQDNINDKPLAIHAKVDRPFLLSSSYYHIFLSIFLFKPFWVATNDCTVNNSWAIDQSDNFLIHSYPVVGRKRRWSAHHRNSPACTTSLARIPTAIQGSLHVTNTGRADNHPTLSVPKAV